MNAEIEKIRIRVQIQEPTEKQRLTPKFQLRHKMVVQTAENFLNALVRNLKDKTKEIEKIKEQVEIVMSYSKTGKLKIDYSEIKAYTLRVQVRKLIQACSPRVF